MTPPMHPDDARRLAQHEDIKTELREGVNREVAERAREHAGGEDVRELGAELDRRAVREVASAEREVQTGDGMGGHTNGELASAVAIDTIAAFAARSLPADRALGADAARSHEGFQNAARECQRRIREAATRAGASLDLGTTLTALYAYEGFAEVAHVGDSRAYLVRPNAGSWRLTHDHTLGASLEAATGEPAPGVAHVLTNAIGATNDDPRVEALHVPMAPGDRFLLCSDGLTDYVDDATIRADLEAATSADQAAERLLSRALQTEAADNITLVVAFV